MRARRGVFSLSIFNDGPHEGLNAEIAAAMRRVKPGGQPYTRSAPGCLITTMYWKHWPCLFPQHGPGRKHERKIELADRRREIVQKHPGRFLRGLFHSDGCRFTNWTEKIIAGRRKRYEDPRYFFSNSSPDIIDLCTWALDLLEIDWRMARPNAVSVARHRRR